LAGCGYDRSYRQFLSFTLRITNPTEIIPAYKSERFPKSWQKPGGIPACLLSNAVLGRYVG